jgi:L-iditol 2-dehydrogenase
LKKEGADIVFECSGDKAAQESSIDLVRRGGAVVLFGCSPENQMISVSPFKINENELSIYGSFNNPYTTATATRLINAGIIKIHPIISHQIALKDIKEAFKLFGKEGSNKIIIIP